MKQNCLPSGCVPKYEILTSVTLSGCENVAKYRVGKIVFISGQATGNGNFVISNNFPKPKTKISVTVSGNVGNLNIDGVFTVYGTVVNAAFQIIYYSDDFEWFK